MLYTLNVVVVFMCVFQKTISGFLENGRIRKGFEGQKFVRRSVDVLPTSWVLSYKI
jgi:hypothetical protein